MSMNDGLDQASPVIDRLGAAVRDNPLAAGLIGAGVAWMLFGGSKGLGRAAGIVTAAAGAAGSAVNAAGDTVAGAVAQAGASINSGVREAVAGVGTSTSEADANEAFEATSRVQSAVGDGMNAAAAASREYGAVIQSKLSDCLERQPLVLGAIGLAIGAGIASTFATTKVESEMVGTQSAAARDTLQEFADDVKEHATQVLSDVKDEAERQGLTAAAAKSAMKDATDKAKNVAAAGRDSIKGQFAD